MSKLIKLNKMATNLYNILWIKLDKYVIDQVYRQIESRIWIQLDRPLNTQIRNRLIDQLKDQINELGDQLDE